MSKLTYDDLMCLEKYGEYGVFYYSFDEQEKRNFLDKIFIDLPKECDISNFKYLVIAENCFRSDFGMCNI